MEKLVDDEEWKARLHYDFDYYANIENDQVLSQDAYVGHFWYGGRAELTLGKILSRAEYIYFRRWIFTKAWLLFEDKHIIKFFII